MFAGTKEASEDSTRQRMCFPGSFGKPVLAQFDQREGSSGGGALLLKAADRRYGLVAGLASRLREQQQGASFLARVGGATGVLDRLRPPGRQRFGPLVRGSDSQTTPGSRSGRGLRPGLAADVVAFREPSGDQRTLSLGRVPGGQRNPAARRATEPSR